MASTDVTQARAAYQSELEQLRLQVELMGVWVDQNLERMRSVLHTAISDEADLALAADDEIDAMQVSLTERCYDLLAREQPVAPTCASSSPWCASPPSWNASVTSPCGW